MRNPRIAALGCALALALGLAACGSERRAPVSGSIRIDGSYTGSPLTRAMAKRFMAENPRVRISVETSGIDRGFKRLCRGEVDAVGAFDGVEEARAPACASGADWGKIPVADDAVVVIVNPAHRIRCLTTDQLRQIWHGNSEVTNNWNQVDGIHPPYDKDLTAWGPGIDTETFFFFTKAVNGHQGETRDYNNSLHHPRYTVQAIAGSDALIAYVDWSLYRKNARALKALAVDSGDGCVAPTPETIADGSFRPLARRLFLYMSARAVAQPAMDAFLRFYLDNVETVAPKVGFVAPTDDQLSESRERLDRLAQAATER